VRHIKSWIMAKRNKKSREYRDRGHKLVPLLPTTKKKCDLDSGVRALRFGSARKNEEIGAEKLRLGGDIVNGPKKEEEQ